jgi:hypothetical protein
MIIIQRICHFITDNYEDGGLEYRGSAVGCDLIEHSYLQRDQVLRKFGLTTCEDPREIGGVWELLEIPLRTGFFPGIKPFSVRPPSG